MPQYYSLREVIGGYVYDIYGLFFGEVCGYEFYIDTIRLKTCISYKAKTLMPDIEKLKELLRLRDVEIRGDEPLEYILNLAYQFKLDIPYRSVERDVRILKSFVNVEEIAVIDRFVSDRGVRTLILLKNPREARFRGWKSEPVKPHPDPSILEGKHVVSISNGYLGVVKEVVLGPGVIALRILSYRSGDAYISWIKFLNDLRRKGMMEEYNILSSIRDPLKHRRISLEEYTILVEELEKKGVGEELINELSKYIEYSSWGIIHIPYERVMYVNDIIVSY